MAIFIIWMLANIFSLSLFSPKTNAVPDFHYCYNYAKLQELNEICFTEANSDNNVKKTLRPCYIAALAWTSLETC